LTPDKLPPAPNSPQRFSSNSLTEAPTLEVAVMPIRRIAVALLSVSLLASTVYAAEAPSRFDPYRPATERALPVARPAPHGPVRVPRDLALEALRPAEEEVAPDDRPGNPAYEPVRGKASGPKPANVIHAGFGPNVRINVGPEGNAEAEVSLAAIGSKLIGGWNDGEFFGVQPGFTGYGYSSDDGVTWTDGGGLPVATSTDIYYGDPVLASDPAGHFYFANLYRPTSTEYGIGVNHGTFAGAAPVWDLPVAVSTSAADFLDKPWITVDPSTGYVYLAYIRFIGTGGQQLEFSRSTDHGATWSAPMAITDPASSAPMSPRLAVDLSGGLYLAYHAYDIGLGQEFHRIRKSADLGVSFGAEHDIGGRPFFNNYFSGPAGYNRERMVALVSLAVDRTGSASDGRLYATWQEMVDIDADPLGGAEVPEIEANGSSATATPFVLGATLAGSLSSTIDQDWWSFAGTAGQTVIFYLLPDASPCNGFLRMFAGGGATANRCAFSHFSGGVGFVVFTLPSSGTYYVRVLNWDGVAGNIGAYNVYTGTHAPNALDIARDHRDVMFSSSSDGGATWTTPVVANDEPGRFDNSFPEVAVDGTGAVYADWYDHRNDPANGILTDIYYTSSTNGGATFAPSAIVNDGGSVNWNNVVTNIFPNMGDYSALVGQGLKVYANWADGRDGTPDSYFASLTVPSTDVDPGVVPAGSFVIQAVPNPVLHEARFPLPRGVSVASRLWIFDQTGRRVRVLDRAGSEVFVWDRRDDAGLAVAPGVYLYRLEGQSAAGRAVVLN